MKIHVADNQILTTDEKAYLKYREVSNGGAVPFASVVWNDWDIYDYTPPVVGQNDKVTDTIIDDGTGGKTYEVIPMTAQEIADRLVEYKASTIRGNRITAGQTVISRWPQYMQINWLDGTYPTPDPDEAQMQADKGAVIDEENRLADLINTATDIDGVDAAQATANWPVLGDEPTALATHHKV